MDNHTLTVPEQEGEIQFSIESMIMNIRGQQVMLDRDLARLYGVETRRLNEQVKRNSSRFPSHYKFQLGNEEFKELVAKCDRFLIIDETVYHIGASLKDLGKKVFGLTLMGFISPNELVSEIR